jgi:hypothetical protein
MKNYKILITGADKAKRLEFANEMLDACRSQGIPSSLTDFGKHDVPTGVQIPPATKTAIFVAHHEEKKFAGIYTRLIEGSRDKLSFAHIDLK